MTLGNFIGALLGLVLPFSAAYGRLSAHFGDAAASGGMQRLEEVKEPKEAESGYGMP